MTRRQLALATAAVATAQGDTENKKYGGALEGYETKVDLKEFDPVANTLELYRSAPLKLTFQATDRKQAEAWQKKLRPKIIELVGGFPASRSRSM